jgi:YD repeat-containing protein
MAGYIAARGRLFRMRRDGADKIIGRHDAERGEFTVSQVRIVLQLLFVLLMTSFNSTAFLSLSLSLRLCYICVTHTHANRVNR